jgi:NAD/NADP transhydrogenase beta subunit
MHRQSFTHLRYADLEGRQSQRRLRHRAGSRSGYAGIQNQLFFDRNCEMVYGDAQAVPIKTIEAVRGLDAAAAA